MIGSIIYMCVVMLCMSVEIVHKDRKNIYVDGEEIYMNDEERDVCICMNFDRNELMKIRDEIDMFLIRDYYEIDDER